MSVTSHVGYQVRSGFGVITLDNPPVNALSPGVVEECMGAIEEGIHDNNVQGLIIFGRGGKFSGGADITSFKDAVKPGARSLRHLLELIEKSDKGFIACIEGIALGGGLELALACDHRCASVDARIGLPEIKLGLLPGAGGTQRLPRLIGQKGALDIILNGEPLSATEALACGIVDELIDGDFVEQSIDFAIDRLEAKKKRRVSEFPCQANPEIIACARSSVRAVEQGGLAHHKAIDCIELAAKTAFADGISIERQCFEELLKSTQAQSRIHLFFAERSASKIPGLSRDVVPRSIKTAAVIGAGTMGNGIAINLLNAGIPVTMIDTSPELVKRGRKTVESIFSGMVVKGRISQSDCERSVKALTTSTEYDGLKNVDIAIEAVFENMQIKQEVFRALSAICRADAILATNTSTLDIDQIASAAENPERVIGMHFFSPANIMKLLEVVRGELTSPEVIVTALAIGKAMKKVSVLVGNCDGFVGNRMLNEYVREAELLLEEGALPQQIDRVMTAFGFAMGPFAVGDLAGIDVHARIREERKTRGAASFRESNISRVLYEKGRYGQKTSAGWYRYEGGSRKPIVDELVTEIILSESKRVGVTRNEISDEQIIKRCLYPLVNEGARILEEGIAIHSSDIDIIWIYGYGFPPFKGGPMFWADSIGLYNILTDLKSFQKEFGDAWKPASMLEKLVENNQTFSDFKR